VRRLIASIALALPLAAWANPTDVDLRNYRTKLSQFLGERMSRDKATTVLNGWFGRDFEAKRDDTCACWDYFVVVRNREGTILYFRRIGTATEKDPYQLLLEVE
jgi:hypothetical protein